MKAKNLIASAVALTLASSAFADVTVDITGATAFRQAALKTIHAQFVASGQPFKFAHDQTPGKFDGATLSVFVGTFPGVTGTTTIRTCFNGSVQGLNALINSPAQDPAYWQENLLDSVTATTGGTEVSKPATAVASKSQSEIAFSDVSVASTPFANASLLPADAAVGVVTFTMLLSEGLSEGAPAPFDNITSQQFKAVFANGFQPLSMFTGNAADADKFVFATGRNDGSGTRTTYLAETGYGIARTVEQYIVPTQAEIGKPSSTSSSILAIRRVPASNGSNASIIWGKDVAGNGGYNSGSALRGDMAKTTASVEVFDDQNNSLFTGPIYLITWLSTGDAVTAIANGAKLLKYNGVGITPTVDGLSAADKAKVTEGEYTAWGFQQMYRRGDLESGDVVSVYDAIKAGIGANLDDAGIPLEEMNVTRGDDGGPVVPKNL